MRIGHGYDVHAFGPGNSLILGGVTIPYQQAFIAHSDGDVTSSKIIKKTKGLEGYKLIFSAHGLPEKKY